MSAWLGIDVGTQGTRALLVDDNGRELSSAQEPFAVRTSAAWWADSAEAAIAQCLIAVAGRRIPIAGIAVASTSGTVVELDHARRIRRTLLYSEPGDPTIGAEVRRAGADVWARLGYPMADDWGLVKAVASARSENPPAAMTLQADAIVEALGAKPGVTDWSHALKLGYDTEGRAWPIQVLERLSLNPDTLPRVVAPGTALGAVSTAAAARTGLIAGTPIFAGMTDGCATQLATGTIDPGSWVGIIGSTLVVKGASAVRHGDAATGSYSHLAPDGRTWFPGGASNAGALAIAARMSSDTAARLTAQLPPVATLPVIYPLPGRGERFPFAAPDATTFVLGEPGRDAMSLDDAEYLGGVMLGLALLERLALETVGADVTAVETSIALAGGATANPWWNRIRAGAMSRPCRAPRQRGAALGAAMLAAAGARSDGMAGLGAVVDAMTGDGEFVIPNEDEVAVLDDRYADLVAEFVRRGWIGAPVSGRVP